MRGMTVAILALVAMPALASAQDSTRQQVDSARTKMQQQQPQDSTGTRTGTSRGRRASSSGNMGLSRDQVTQLQSALSGAGCDAGAADGIVGPKTRSAMACARQKNNVTTNAELYRALNLDFATSGRAPSRGTHDAPTAVRATHGDSSQVGGPNRGRIRPPATDSSRKPMGDSTRRDSTQRDSTQRDSTQRDTTQRDTTSH